MDERKKDFPGSILWWGRSTLSYSRNEILLRSFAKLGCSVTHFRPKSSYTGGLEASLRTLPKPDLLWVPCFRHRDMASALSFAKKREVPLVFDPLISAYDKQVCERKKFSSASIRAKMLFNQEKRMLQGADLVIADTKEHARYFHHFFSVEKSRLAVIPIGANETLFTPASPTPPPVPKKEYTALFYGSFLGLQNPQVIIEAAHLCKMLPIKWQFVGEGPLLGECKKLAEGVPNIEFIPWVAYAKLPEIIRSADIVLGIFGISDKAKRVIPNKVYQALACGKPLITMASSAYPDNFTENSKIGIQWVKAGSARELANAVAALLNEPQQLATMGSAAHTTYRRYFSEASIREQLATALSRLL